MVRWENCCGKSCVKYENHFSEFLNVEQGVLQGEALFPLLFFFMLLMMYADNMDLSSESPEGLQNIYLIHFMNIVRTGNNPSMLFRANTTCIMNR